MPKKKTAKSLLVRQWTRDSNCFSVQGETVFCQPCGKQVQCEKKFHLSQHEKTASHQSNVRRSEPSPSRQSFLPESIADGTRRTFYADLCAALVAANIPWAKVGNPVFKQFLEKYCKEKVPAESTLRKNYLRPLYEETLRKIRAELADACIWISVDETTDVTGRLIAHFVVGKLSPHEETKPFLVCSKQLDKTNAEAVAYFVNSSLKILYPVGMEDSRVLLLYTDAAPYMHKAASLLKVFFPKMLHVTCLAHAIHRVCEELRKAFTGVNEVIAAGKAVFLKAPSRVCLFKEKLPGVPLPPEPIVTRWGTWLNAVVYYSKHFSSVKAVIGEFSADESAAVRRAQAAFSETGVEGDLAYLCTHFAFLADTIRKLETSGATLTKNVGLILDVEGKFDAMPSGPIRTKIRSKLQSVLNKNSGFAVLKEVAKVLSGESSMIPGGVESCNVPHYKYAPVTSVDVERSFSAYKLILSERRQSFDPVNLEMLLVCYCFANISHCA